MATFAVRASAAKERFSLSIASEQPLVLKAGIPAEPVDGRANRVLLSELEKLLCCKASIISGHRSRRKVVAVECTLQEVLQRVKSIEKNE